MRVRELERGPASGVAEFSRVIPVDSLPRAPEAVRASATPEECAALARRFDLLSLSGVSVTAEIARWRGGVRVKGRVSGEAVHRSVRTLDPVPQSVDEQFDRGFLPDAGLVDGIKPGAEIEMPFDAELGDSPDPLGGAIDVGELAAETLALALDPYPREQDEGFADLVAGPEGKPGMTDEDAKPFASLAEYRDRLAGKKDEG